MNVKIKVNVKNNLFFQPPPNYVERWESNGLGEEPYDTRPIKKSERIRKAKAVVRTEEENEELSVKQSQKVDLIQVN